MANPVINNNGDPSLGDPDIILFDENGIQTVIAAGCCVGLDPKLDYTIKKSQG